MIDFVIEGAIPCLKNSIRVGKGGRFYHKDNAVHDYKEAFALLCPKSAKKGLTGPVEVILHIYKQNNRLDAVNLQSIIYDSLEFAGVIKNDRLVTDWHCYSEIDRTNPRVRIEVNELEEVR